MRKKLGEGEWIVALDKGISMIKSCEEIKKPRYIVVRREQVIMNYFQNLRKMSPFDFRMTMKQLDVKLEAIDFWIDHRGRIRSSTNHRYGRN